MTKRGMKPITAVIFPLIAAIAVIVFGIFANKKAEETYRKQETLMPKVQLAEVLESIQG